MNLKNNYFLKHIYDGVRCETLTKLSAAAKKQKFIKDQIIFKENEKITDVYIIILGEVLVKKKKKIIKNL